MLAGRNLASSHRVEVAGQSRSRLELVEQARRAYGLGSPFVGQVLEAAARQLDRAPVLATLIDRWPGDFAADAVAMRLNAGLHAQARRKVSSPLGQLYRHRCGDFDEVIGTALEAGEADLLQWMAWPTQTNEVARSSAFMAALAALSSRDPKPVELLEIGASAGLNLNVGRYRHVLGGRVHGDPESRLTIAPDWHGGELPRADVRLIDARGVDLRPIDIAAASARERMMAFVWADRDDRASRLREALNLAHAHPPRVEQGSALEWLPAQLARPQAAGVRRVVVHSMVAQYLTSAERRSLFSAILQAGGRASTDRPLAWISLEWTRDRREVQLRAMEWPGAGAGELRTLAVCHPYGENIKWLGRQS